MSDAQKLKDAVAELHKANKNYDDKLRKAVDESRQSRQVTEEQSNR